MRLEQNYRSTGNILNAANALIAHNPAGWARTCGPRTATGEPIRRYAAFNEVDEARFVVERIRDWVAGRATARGECAILYRTTAQSRLFEEALISADIPYRVYGGLRFFERAEIRDALAYLRLLANRDDDAAFERVVNTADPRHRRRTLERCASAPACLSLWEAALTCSVPPSCSAPRGRGAARLPRPDRAPAERDRGTARSARPVEHVIAGSGLVDHYQKDKGEKGEAAWRTWRNSSTPRAVASTTRPRASTRSAPSSPTRPWRPARPRPTPGRTASSS